MGKQRIIAETGAGQHGVATATACALLGLECIVYMGTEDIRRQAPNVERMKLLGAEVAPVEAGARTLKEAVSAAIRDWVANVETTHYVIGSAVGPAPYPSLVRDLQRVIGEEARAQSLAAEGALPRPGDRLRRRRLQRDRHLRPVRRRRRGRAGRRRARAATGSRPDATGPRWGRGRPACCTARSPASSPTRTARSSRPTRSPPGSTTRASGPEHAYLRETGRASYFSIDDEGALDALGELARLEGIIPALESLPRDRLAAGEPARGRGFRRPLPLGARRQGPGRVRDARHRGATHERRRGDASAPPSLPPRTKAARH